MPISLLKYLKYPVVVFLVSLLSLTLAGCQPSPDERFDRAQAYFAASDYRAAVIELKNVLQHDPDAVAARRLLADASFILADLATAESEYRKLLGDGVADTDVLAAYGRTLLVIGKPAEVLERIAPAIENGASDAPLHVLLGDAHVALGDVGQADLHYRAALDDDPQSAGGLVGRAVLAARAEDWDRADAELERALAHHPADPVVLRTRADLLRARFEFAAAADAYAAAIGAERPDTPLSDRFLARRGRIAALIDASRLDDAAATLDEFAMLAPSSPLIPFFRGHIAFSAGDYDAAEAHLLNYLSAVPDDAAAQGLLGAVSFSKNKLGQAEQYLSGAVRANVGGDRVRMLLAETQLRLNKPAGAAKLLEDRVGGGDVDPAMLAILGRARLGQDDAEAAIELFERVLENDAEGISVNLALATSYLKARRYADAEQLLLALPSATAADYRRELLLFAVYLEQDKTAAARELAQNLIRANRSDPNAHVLVSELYRNVGDFERSRAHMDRALELDPANTAALYFIGTAASEAGDLDRSIAMFERLLDVDPVNVLALFQLAGALDRTDALERIEPRLSAALQQAPESLGLRKLSARFRLMTGNLTAAADDVEAARDLAPNDPDVAHIEGLVALQAGDVADAIRHLGRATAGSSTAPGALLDLARARLLNRDYALAAISAREYRKLRPEDVQGLAVEVDAELRRGDPERAREAATGYAASYPDEAFLQLLLGDIELASRNPAVALARYESYATSDWSWLVALRMAQAHLAARSNRAAEPIERWLAGNPDDALARRIYAQLLEGSGRSDQAIAQYRLLERSGDIDATGLNNLAWQYMLQNRPEAAVLAERAHAMEPDNGDIADTLGWILYRGGEYERAAQILDLAVRKSPENPEIRYHLAAALVEVGRAGEARSLLQELLEGDADFPSRADADALFARL